MQHLPNFFFIDYGCNKGDRICLNDGNCKDDGSCECKLGYVGSRCSECEYK
jgi:hypothetical protein